MNFKNLLFLNFLCVSLFSSAFSLDKIEQAEKLREDGKTLEALNVFNEAIVENQQKGDYSKVLTAMMGEIICWQHQFKRSKDKVYAILVKKNAEAMIDIAEYYKIYDIGHKLHLFLSRSFLLSKDYPEAVKELRIAVELYPNDDAEKGDYIGRLGYATYLNGDKQKGKDLMLDGLQQIQKHADKTDDFRVNVWVSGIYLHLADLLRLDNKEEGQYYLDKAQQLINKDARLVIRKEQLSKIEKEYEQKQ